MKQVQKLASVPKNRVGQLDMLRMVSIFAVMLIHQAATGYTLAEPGSDEWAVCLAFNSAARFAVPSFAMISGAMYLNPEREVTAAHISKKVRKLLTVFLFWSVLYALAETWKEQEALLLLPLLRRIVTGHYHMWYIYLIAALYLTTPLLRTVTAGRNLRAAMLVMFTLGCAARLPDAGAPWKQITGNFSAIFTYTGYYCLGHYLYSRQFSKKRIVMCFLLAGGLLAAVIASGDPAAIFSEKMPHIIFYSAGIFLVFKNAAARRGKMAGKIAPCVFGMYLVHPVFNFLLRKAGLYALTGDPLLLVPLCSILVWSASLLAVLCMKKLPLLRQFV